MPLSEMDRLCFQRAIALANEAGEHKNLPIGAVISFQGEIVGEGKNTIWYPELSLYRHAEIEALRSVPTDQWEHAQDMCLYSTLEPCLMCLGAILLHGIGRVVFGTADPYGGASTVINQLPPFFAGRFSKISWEGPALPELCDPLYQRVKILENF
jgi:tRNA(adenine34) deaminase